MEEFNLISFDGTDIHCYMWNNVENPKAVVQIAHGMGEHCGRYDDFASFLNKNGYIVIAEDHRGHGKTCGYEKRGIVEGDSYNDTISDMIALTNNYAIKKYKLPVVLVGHSYGSFLSQGYIERNGDALAGVILSGSAYMNTAQVAFGRVVASIQNALCGGEKPANLIAKLSFGAYDKQFKEENQPFAWLTRDKEVVKKYIADEYCGAAFNMSIAFQKSFFYGMKTVYRPESLKAIPKELPVFIASGDMQDEAVEKSIPMADYGPVEEKLKRVASGMLEGHSIAQAAYDEELFEPTYGRMLLAGERSGNLENVLERLTDLLEENCSNEVDRLVGFVDPLLSGILMVTVGLSLLSVMLPLIGMMNSVG